MRDLTDEQRDHFAAVMTEWLAEARYTGFVLADHADKEILSGMALHCADHQ